MKNINEDAFTEYKGSCERDQDGYCDWTECSWISREDQSIYSSCDKFYTTIFLYF